MEPMTLGSPAGSPHQPPTFGAAAASAAAAAAAGGVVSPTANPGGSCGFSGSFAPSAASGHHPGGFLPGYLMGDYSQQSPAASGRMISPAKLNRSLSHHQPPQPSTPQTPSVPPSGFLTPSGSGLRGGRTSTPSAADKQGGPPTTGLFSSPATARVAGGGGNLGSGPTGTPNFGTPKLGVAQTPMPGTPQLSFGATPTHRHNASVREEILNASSTCRDVAAADTWVTVFGFPPSAASYILSHFSQCGTILRHHTPPNGNWMHLKFQTKMQAHKALGKSGKILGGSIMIGVGPCTDTTSINDIETGECSSSFLHGNNVNNSVLMPTLDSSVANLNSSLGGARLNSSIRPLTQAYKAAASENEITAKSNTPNKNSGLVSKAMEYIFGW